MLTVKLVLNDIYIDIFAGLWHKFSDNKYSYGADVQTQACWLYHLFHGGDRQGNKWHEALSKLQS